MSDGNNWATAWELLARAIGAAAGKSSGGIDDVEHLSVDQQLKVAEIAALLAISQDVNHLRHMGMNPEFDNGL